MALREVCYLFILDCNTLFEKKYHLNENSWDSHVSFNTLYLSASPDQKSLSISTDNNLHLVCRLGIKKRLRTLSAHTCGSYGKPKVVQRLHECCRRLLRNITYIGFVGLYWELFDLK